MSFTARIGNIEIVCDTLDELDAVVARYREDPGPTSTKSASTKSASPKSPAKLTPASTARAARPKELRGVAEATYNKHSWRIVRLLLKDEHRSVGKLTTTIATELNINRVMLRIILARLSAETPKFLVVGADTARGVAPYVRLTDAKVAEDWATAQEALFRESLKVV
jgi:hypothetical protein